MDTYTSPTEPLDGISEEELLKNVKEVKGDVYLHAVSSEDSDFSWNSLEKIGGNFPGSYSSKIKSAKNLRKIGGYLIARNNKTLKIFESLEK